MTNANPQAENDLGEENALAFAPMHKRYFGVAVGSAVALFVIVLTLVHVFMFKDGEGAPLGLLIHYFYGYGLSVKGALVGGVWAFVVGWIAGWFLAFCRNLVISAAVFFARARANLETSKRFLDDM